MKQRHLRTVVGVAATVFFLWLALRGVHWTEVLRHLRGANYLLLGAAILLTTFGIHVRALRWKSLLAPVDPDTSFHSRMAGAAVGFGANNVLPARMGEFARVLVTARLAKLPLSAVFATLVMERVLDGLACVGLLFGVMALPSFPAGELGGMDVRRSAQLIAAMMAGVGALALGMALFPRHAAAAVQWIADRLLPTAFRRPLVDAMRAFLGGLGVLRNPRLLAVSLGWVVFQWLYLGLSYYLALLAFGIDEPGYAGALFLQSVVTVAVSIPSAPGFFGTFEWAATKGLGLWGVEQARAVSFAIGFHLGGFLSVTLLGAWYAWRLDLSWRDLVSREDRVEDAVEEGESPPPGADRKRA